MSARDTESNTPKEHKKVSLAQIAAISLIVVLGGALILFAVSGTWPALVAVESDSMSPHLNVGDMVLIIQKDRLGPLMTKSEAKEAGIKTFGGYGDIIVYTPNGNTRTTPLMHRIVENVTREKAIDKYGFTEEYAVGGYITKGDHNTAVDQSFSFSGIGRVYPVQEEWITGKALIAVPLVGYILLNIWPISAVILVILLLYEIIGRWQERREESEK